MIVIRIFEFFAKSPENGLPRPRFRKVAKGESETIQGGSSTMGRGGQKEEMRRGCRMVLE
jgi:hypothetical protein